MNPRIVYCSTSGYGQTGPRSQWAGHDLNYLAVGGYLDCSGRDAEGGPALPGATIGDAAGGGMQAVVAILAALVQRATTGEGAYLDVSVADGVVALMSLYVDEYFATGVVPGPGHNIFTGRYACYDVYRCADDRWVAVGAIEPQFYANLCRALDCERWLAHQTDDAVQDAIRADFRAAFAHANVRDEWVARARSGRHVRVGGGLGAGVGARRALPAAPRVRRSDGTGRRPRDLRAGRLGARGHGPEPAGARRARGARSPTPTRCWRKSGTRPGRSRPYAKRESRRE